MASKKLEVKSQQKAVSNTVTEVYVKALLGDVFVIIRKASNRTDPSQLSIVILSVATVLSCLSVGHTDNNCDQIKSKTS